MLHAERRIERTVGKRVDDVRVIVSLGEQQGSLEVSQQRTVYVSKGYSSSRSHWALVIFVIVDWPVKVYAWRGWHSYPVRAPACQEWTKTRASSSFYGLATSLPSQH